MEIIKRNYIQTTTSIVVQSNTGSAKNIMDFETRTQYVSSGFNDDLTTTTLTVNFDVTTAVSRIILRNHNFNDFTIYYNGATASQFAFTATAAATTTSDWSDNSETSQYLIATSVNCTSVSIDVTKTITADSEKAIGYFVCSDLRLDFERSPSAKNYKPKIDPKRIEHKLADGRIRVHKLRNLWSFNIKYKHISKSFVDSLRTIYDLEESFIFAAFPTSTSWDEVAAPCTWVGPFTFYEYSDDSVNAGFSGSISLKESTE